MAHSAALGRIFARVIQAELLDWADQTLSRLAATIGDVT